MKITYAVEVEIEATPENDLSYVMEHGISEDEILGEISTAVCAIDVFEGAVVTTSWAENSSHNFVRPSEDEDATDTNKSVVH